MHDGKGKQKCLKPKKHIITGYKNDINEALVRAIACFYRGQFNLFPFSAMSQTIWKAGEDESHKKGNSLTL